MILLSFQTLQTSDIRLQMSPSVLKPIHRDRQTDRHTHMHTLIHTFLLIAAFVLFPRISIFGKFPPYFCYLCMIKWWGSPPRPATKLFEIVISFIALYASGTLVTFLLLGFLRQVLDIWSFMLWLIIKHLAELLTVKLNGVSVSGFIIQCDNECK